MRPLLNRRSPWRRPVLWAALALVCAAGACKKDRIISSAGHALSDAARPRQQQPPIGYDPLKMLDTKTRDTSILPQKALSWIKLKRGLVVADVGAGPGYFTFRLARAVGRKGVVYALEVRDSILDILRRRARDEARNPYGNIVFVNNREDDTNLQPESVDRALLAEVHISLARKVGPNEASMMASIFRTLKPGGLLLVLEPRKNSAFPDYVPANIVAHFRGLGFELIRSDERYSEVTVAFLFRKPG